MTIPILFEHDDFLIVNKPSGVEMHDVDSGIISVLKNQLRREKLYLVHRLDKPTSGCLIIAHTKQAAARLSACFSERTVEKYYLALVDKKPKKKQGTICGDMINRRKGQRALVKTKLNPAITQFHSYSVAPKLRLAVVKPLTGKTHQIRVAMKSISAPIIGDERYGGTMADRLYLHAWQLRLNYQNELIECTAPLTSGELFAYDKVKHCIANIGSAEQLTWP